MDVSDTSNPFDSTKRVHHGGDDESRNQDQFSERAPVGEPLEHSNVYELVRPFDPLSEEAEPQYDVVVRRINKTRVRLLGNELERSELERQFVENDLVVDAGSRKGKPLSAKDRRDRIRRLVELGVEAERLIHEEQFSVRALARMNDELDRWARETYGP